MNLDKHKKIIRIILTAFLYVVTYFFGVKIGAITHGWYFNINNISALSTSGWLNLLLLILFFTFLLVCLESTVRIIRSYFR